MDMLPKFITFFASIILGISCCRYVICSFQNNIEALGLQSDQFESEIEGLEVRKKRLDRDVRVLFLLDNDGAFHLTYNLISKKQYNYFIQ